MLTDDHSDCPVCFGGRITDCPLRLVGGDAEITPCPYCGCRTDDPYGGPCTQCWAEVKP